jgi:hypothetical protein
MIARIMKAPGPIFKLKSPKKPEPKGYNLSPTRAGKIQAQPTSTRYVAKHRRRLAMARIAAEMLTSAGKQRVHCFGPLCCCNLLLTRIVS